MAGTWRVSIETVEGLGRTSFLDQAKQALKALNRRESAGYDEDEALTSVIVEVGAGGDGSNVQRTKPFNVSDEGTVKVNRVMFVPAPARGSPLVVRLIKPQKLQQNTYVAEAQIHNASGAMQVDMLKKGRIRGSLRCNVTSGLPTPPGRPEPAPSGSALPESPVASPVAAAVGPAVVMSPVPMPAVQSSPPLAYRPPELPPANSGDRPMTVQEVAAARAVVSGPVLRAPPVTSTPQVLQDPTAAAAATAAAAQSAAKSSRPDGKRPLRMRPQGLPWVGSCDATISDIQGLDSLQRPYVVVGLEGHEFRAEDIDGQGNPASRGPLRYSFTIGSMQSNLAIYVYQDVPGPHVPVGRVLVPLTDTLWPVGEAPGLGRLKAACEREDQSYRREYVLRFLPVSEAGDGYGEPGFLDSYTPTAVSTAHNAFGSVTVELEVLLRAEAQPLLAFYAKAIVQRMAQLGDEGAPTRSRSRMRQGRQGDDADDDFRSVLRSLERLRQLSARPSDGLGRWLRADPSNGIMASVGWFIFCMAGFFPCSIWLVPVYAWLLLVLNGYLAASQRAEDWESQSRGQSPLFWREEEVVAAGAGAPGHESDKSLLAKCRRALRDVEPFLLTEAAFGERLHNALTFVDGAASSAFFMGLGLAALLISLSLMIISFIDPSLSFFCGAYGAFGLFKFSRPRPPGPAAEPQWLKWAANEALACVPDDVQVAHRYVATRVQMVDV